MSSRKLRLRLLVEGPFVFLKSWLARGHVLGGWNGFVFSVAIAFARFLRVAKMIERQEARRKGR